MMKIYTNDSFDKALEKVFYNFAEEPDKSLPVVNDYIERVRDIIEYCLGVAPASDEDIPRGFFPDDEEDEDDDSEFELKNDSSSDKDIRYNKITNRYFEKATENNEKISLT